jgi:hypothetical protein
MGKVCVWGGGGVVMSMATGLLLVEDLSHQTPAHGPATPLPHSEPVPIPPCPYPPPPPLRWSTP